MGKLRIDVKTPKGQAEKCINKQKLALLGFKGEKKVVYQEVVDDQNFYYILEFEDVKEQNKVISKCARAEVTIRQFYAGIFKLIKKVNKLAGKFKKGGKWAKKWVLKKLRKQNPHQYQDNDMYKYFEDTPEDEFLTINDEEEMKQFLAQDSLISPTIVE